MKKTKEIDYSVKTLYEIEHRPLSDFTSVKNFTDGEDLHVISFKTTVQKSGFYSYTTASQAEKIIHKFHLDELIANPEKEETINKSYKNENPIWLVKKDFLNEITEFGRNTNLHQVLNIKKNDINQFISKDVLKDASNKDYQFVEFVKNENSIYAWRDSENNIYMEPMIFNYISANLENETYDLDSLVEHLLKRDDIAFLTNSESRNVKLLKCPMEINGNEKEIGNIIDDIPGYNASDERNETICIVYYPKTKDADKIINWKRSKESQEIWNIDNFIIREVLGCKAFLNKKAVPEEEQVPKRKFKR